jgi:hypothetical protein
MTVTKDQAQMLATLAVRCRPTGARQWKPDDVMAELAKLTDRNLGAVICATIRAAMDRDANRPAVIASAGSHWSDTQVAAPFVPQVLDAGERCSVCSMSEPACRVRHGVGDHEFKSAAMAAKDAADAAEHVAAVRAEVVATSGPTERRTLEELAEANPELHARIEAVRQNAALKEIPMQETSA